MSATRQEIKNLGLVIYYGLLLGLPVLLFGFPYPTHDGHIHEVWYSNFAAQLWGGEWYPRWLLNHDGGLGGPTFYFYPPIPFFITSLLQPFFSGALHSWRILGVSAALALLLSGLFAYLWLKTLARSKTAALAAILYMALPYHFAVDLHTRGAFGELWSFVWMPLVVFFAANVGRRGGFAVAGIAISYAALIMTHLPTTLIFSVIPPAYVLWRSHRTEKLRRFVWAASGMFVGIGLAAVFLLPAMLGQDAVSMEFMRTGHSYYENGFFFPHPSLRQFVLARDDFEKRLFWIVICTGGVSAVGWFVARGQTAPSLRREVFFWGVVGLLSIAMMLPISKFVYELLGQLKLIQFPWRFNAILSLAAVPIIAIAWDSIKRPYSDSTVGALVISGALILQCFLFATQPLKATSFSESPHLNGPPDDWKANNWNTAEYRPRWCSNDVRKVLQQLRDEKGELRKVLVVQGACTVLVHKWEPRDLKLIIDGREDIVLQVSQYYYPEWSAVLNGTTSLSVTPSTDGLIRMAIPSGTHTLRICLAKSKWERLGEIISLSAAVTLLLFCGAVGWKRWRNRARPPAQTASPGNVIVV